jgi:hypothetical protein
MVLSGTDKITNTSVDDGSHQILLNTYRNMVTKVRVINFD